MSEAERKYPYAEARQIAGRYLDLLLPCFQRLEIAGSLRRRKSEVGDIELVGIPRMTGGLFGNSPAYIPPMGRVLKDGERYKQYLLAEGMKLDLFIILPPAEWGVIFTIRTGGERFSKMVVTQRNKGGWLPSDMAVRDGALWRGSWEKDIYGVEQFKPGEFIRTPEEADFFREIGLKWVAPPNR